ncbi:hypothetical protein V6O07_02905 [Arthrospira platensis SPKY2]
MKINTHNLDKHECRYWNNIGRISKRGRNKKILIKNNGKRKTRRKLKEITLDEATDLLESSYSSME